MRRVIRAISFSDSVPKQPAAHTRLRDLAAEAPEVCHQIPALSNQRAQGKPGARCTRGLVCNMRRKCAHEHTGPAEASRLSLRDGFTAYFVLSPVTRLLATVACDRIHKLDARTGASGPHDFAVRISAVRRSAHPRPPHPAPRP